MYRLLLTTLFALIAAVSVDAQSIDSLIMRLAQQNSEGAYVDVDEDRSVAMLIRGIEAQDKESSVVGYRLVIFFNNDQSARENAERTFSEFCEKYPDINAYLVYENPYFKVSVGDCLTMEEALILNRRISADYPKAFPRNEEIKLSDLQNVRVIEEVIESDSLMVMQPQLPAVANEEQP